jgi:hypothetical protein
MCLLERLIIDPEFRRFLRGVIYNRVLPGVIIISAAIVFGLLFLKP